MFSSWQSSHSFYLCVSDGRTRSSLVVTECWWSKRTCYLTRRWPAGTFWRNLFRSVRFFYFSFLLKVKHEGYTIVWFPLPVHFGPSNHCFDPWSWLLSSFRTRINTSLVRPRSSSGLARLPTWRSWGQTSCVLLASASRKLFAAGWHARSICASAALPSPSRDTPEDTRLAGESLEPDINLLSSSQTGQSHQRHLIPFYWLLQPKVWRNIQIRNAYLLRHVSLDTPQPGKVHASHSGGHHHPEVPEDVRGEETLQAKAGCRSGHADHSQSLHGPAEVPGGKTHTQHKVQLFSYFVSLTLSSIKSL